MHAILHGMHPEMVLNPYKFGKPAQLFEDSHLGCVTKVPHDEASTSQFLKLLWKIGCQMKNFKWQRLTSDYNTLNSQFRCQNIIAKLITPIRWNISIVINLKWTFTYFIHVCQWIWCLQTLLLFAYLQGTWVLKVVSGGIYCAWFHPLVHPVCTSFHMCHIV